MAELRPMRVGEILDAGLAVYRRHFGLLLQVGLVALWLPVAANVYVQVGGGRVRPGAGAGRRGRCGALRGCVGGGGAVVRCRRRLWLRVADSGRRARGPRKLVRRVRTLLDADPRLQAQSVRRCGRRLHHLLDTGRGRGRHRWRVDGERAGLEPGVRGRRERAADCDDPPARLRLHPDVLRPAGTPRSVRPRGTRPPAGDRLTLGRMLAAPAQGVAPDSLRRALGDVFAWPEYRWVQGRTLWQWLLELWYRVLDWLGTVQTAHPGGYRMLMVALMVLLAGLVAHIGWVVWRITGRAARPAGTAVAA